MSITATLFTRMTQEDIQISTIVEKRENLPELTCEISWIA